MSARDVMDREPLQIMLCKSPDSFCPIGPHVELRHDPNAAQRTSGLDFLTFTVDTRETLKAWA